MAHSVQTWIVLLRGINVGGRNKLTMQQFAQQLERLDCSEIETYIQSGNAVCHADIQNRDAFAMALSESIERAHGFQPAVRLLTASELQKALAANPYPQAEADPKSLHLFFLDSALDEQRIAALKPMLGATESIALGEKVVYLHAPDGVGKSKLVKGIDQKLKVATTARNWRTASRLAAMAQD